VRCTLLVLVLVAGAVSAAEWKPGTVDARFDEPSMRLGRRVHRWVQPGRVAEDSGVQVVRRIGDRVLVSVEAGADVGEPVFTGAKLSHAIRERGLRSSYYVVEFHPDISDADAVAVLGSAGVQAMHHADLLPGHVLVRATWRQLETLADWDEVAYVFPASDHLVKGRTVRACASALAGSGTVGQSIATVGQGWDGAGLGSAALTFTLSRLTAKVPQTLAEETFKRAFGEWSRHVRVTFGQGTTSTAVRNVNVTFESGAHGDAHAFDGAGRTLAHTFYPNLPNPEPIAGDMHFDADENWNIGADLDLYSVTLHELGHALGLGHADKPGAVMYPYYRRVSWLTEEDIGAARSLYAAADVVVLSVNSAVATSNAETTTISGGVSGGQDDIRVTWVSAAGASGLAEGGRTWIARAVPLVPGLNRITFAALDAAGQASSQTVTIARSVPSTPVALAVVSPTPGRAITQSPVVVSGTAFHESGIASVRWDNSRGTTGVASGTASWSAPVPLVFGTNVISITARAVSGAEKTATITVELSSPAATADRTAPSLTITSPASSVYSTSSASVVVKGTALDNVGVVEVWWTRGSLPGTATGTNLWQTSNIPLLIGSNTIVIRARDQAGNTAWRSLVITRR
jgi:hypothetical protein